MRNGHVSTGICNVSLVILLHLLIMCESILVKALRYMIFSVQHQTISLLTRRVIRLELFLYECISLRHKEDYVLQFSMNGRIVLPVKTLSSVFLFNELTAFCSAGVSTESKWTGLAGRNVQQWHCVLSWTNIENNKPLRLTWWFKVSRNKFSLEETSEAHPRKILNIAWLN